MSRLRLIPMVDSGMGSSASVPARRIRPPQQRQEVKDGTERKKSKENVCTEVHLSRLCVFVSVGMRFQASLNNSSKWRQVSIRLQYRMHLLYC